jgi:hypothetical protein
MPRKWPVTFGKGPLEKGRACDTTRIVPGRSEHTSVPSWRPTSSQRMAVMACADLFGGTGRGISAGNCYETNHVWGEVG